MSDQAFPLRTTSIFGLLMLRDDIPRSTATQYWATDHAAIVKRSVPGVTEYIQRHFSPTDHSFWPATGTLGTRIPDAWRLDGHAELRFDSLRALLNASLHQREVFLDEQNAFARVLGYSTAPGGGRWWTTGFDPASGYHVTLLLRRRRGVRRKAFEGFLYDLMAPALLAGGVHDLRAYSFMPWSRLVNTTLGVAHDNPIERRHHGLISFALDDRSLLEPLLASPHLAPVLSDQNRILISVHAHGIERSVPVVTVDR